MKTQLIVGLLILVAGGLLVMYGMNASHAMADQVSHTINGRFTEGTTWYILAGLGLGAGGMYLILTKLLGRRT